MPGPQATLVSFTVVGHLNPAGHIVQSVDASPENEPEGQTTGSCAVEEHLEPAGHVVQVVVFLFRHDNFVNVYERE